MDFYLYEIGYDQEFVRASDYLSGHFDIGIGNVLWSISQCSWAQVKSFIRGKRKLYTGDKESLFAEEILSRFEDVGHKRRYYFKVIVPSNIPATWDGNFGSIRCMLRIIVEHTRQPNKIFESEVFVLPNRDLKLEKHLLLESREDVTHPFHFTVLNFGSIEISIWLPICGIAAGQSLPLLCTIRNKSSAVFGMIMIVLNRNEMYRSTKPVPSSKTETSQITIIKRKTNISHGTYEYYGVLSTEKSIYPTSQCATDACCFVTYDITVQIVSNGSGGRDKLIVETTKVPVIIGTEPLLEWNVKKLTALVTKENFNKRPGSENKSVVDTESEIISDRDFSED